MSHTKNYLEDTIEKPAEKAVNKTLYIKAEDVAIWQKAQELSDDKLTAVLTAHLKNFVAEKEAKASGNSKIILRYKDAGKLPVSKSFYGRWIAPIDDAIDHALDTYAVAVTAKNNIVFFDFIGSVQDEFMSWGKMHVFNSFEEALESKRIAPEIVSMAMAKKGIEIEELDI